MDNNQLDQGSNSQQDQKNRKPRNLGVAVAIGVSCGVALGVSQNDPLLGFSIGVALTAAMWSSGIGGVAKQEKNSE